MKKMIQTGLIISMVLLLINASAQTKTAKTYLDLMVNVVSTNLNYGAANGTLSDYKKSTNGIQAGISFQAGITPAFSIVSELYFMRKGGKLKAGNPFTTAESTLRLNTIELPLLARIHAGRFYINAGPSIAYNFSGKRTLDDLSTKLSFDNSNAGIKRFDAGVQVGGGVEFPFKQRRIAIDIRYAYGLTNISYDKQMYNRAIMISVHFSKAWKTNPLAPKK
jgi:Outer membrane protein beta-barrel domain